MAGAICVGDAASLVDPFTGEGIGNALLSAKLASDLYDLEKHRVVCLRKLQRISKQVVGRTLLQN